MISIVILGVESDSGVKSTLGPDQGPKIGIFRFLGAFCSLFALFLLLSGNINASEHPLRHFSNAALPLEYESGAEWTIGSRPRGPIGQ